MTFNIGFPGSSGYGYREKKNRDEASRREQERAEAYGVPIPLQLPTERPQNPGLHAPRPLYPGQSSINPAIVQRIISSGQQSQPPQIYSHPYNPNGGYGSI